MHSSPYPVKLSTSSTTEAVTLPLNIF